MEKNDRTTLEKLITLATNMENLVKQVNLMDKKLDDIRTEHVSKTDSNIAVMQSKVNRLETILYGTLALCAAEGITLLVTLLSK